MKSNLGSIPKTNFILDYFLIHFIWGRRYGIEIFVLLSESVENVNGLSI